MKYLLVVVVIAVGVWMWRNNRIAAAQDKKQQFDRETARVKTQQIMVSCAYCGLHLPQTEALPATTAMVGPWYCSLEHRQLGAKAG